MSRNALNLACQFVAVVFVATTRSSAGHASGRGGCGGVDTLVHLFTVLGGEGSG